MRITSELGRKIATLLDDEAEELRDQARRRVEALGRTEPCGEAVVGQLRTDATAMAHAARILRRRAKEATDG